jgi:hypothetical protein
MNKPSSSVVKKKKSHKRISLDKRNLFRKGDKQKIQNYDINKRAPWINALKAVKSIEEMPEFIEGEEEDF